MAKEIEVVVCSQELVEELYDKLIEEFEKLKIPNDSYEKMVLEINKDCTNVFIKIPYKNFSLPSESEYLYIKGKVSNVEDNGCLGVYYTISFEISNITGSHRIIEKRDDECLYEFIKFFGLPAYMCCTMDEFNRIEGGKLVNYYRSILVMHNSENIDVKEKFSN